MLNDLRYAIRQLLKNPGFTAVAVLTLALGIGANTAIFSLVHTVVFRPLPVRNASELQELFGTLHNGADYTLQSYLNYKDYRDRNQVFSGVIAYRIVVASLSHNGNNERVWGSVASSNYFDVLGVQPAIGRGFLPEEDQTPKSHPVVVLSYGCWQKRFASERAAMRFSHRRRGKPSTTCSRRMAATSPGRWPVSSSIIFATR
jgi:hypothetical protein